MPLIALYRPNPYMWVKIAPNSGILKPPKNKLNYFHPYYADRYLKRSGRAESIVKSYGDRCEIAVDVRHFDHNEISVKVQDDLLVVEGKHDEKKDSYGSVSRHFVRSYLLPEKCDRDGIVSELSSDGILTVSISYLEAPSRNIPIQYEWEPGENAKAA